MTFNNSAKARPERRASRVLRRSNIRGLYPSAPRRLPVARAFPISQ
jgi:hypothetical protein